jgi:hypothetical protein
MEEKTLNKRYWLIIDFPNLPGHENEITFSCGGVTKILEAGNMARGMLKRALLFIWQQNLISSDGIAFGIFELEE